MKWDFGNIVFSKEQIKRGWVDDAVNTLGTFLDSPETARDYMERVDVSFYGYDDIADELWELPEVRDFIFKIDEKFPYWLFFLSKFCLGLQCVYLCSMPPFLTSEARARIFPEELAKLLQNRWLPAMNHVALYAGLNEGQIERLTDRSVSYFTEGPLRMTRDWRADLKRKAATDSLDDNRYFDLLPTFQFAMTFIDRPNLSFEEQTRALIRLLNEEFGMATDKIRECQKYVARFLEDEVMHSNPDINSE